MQPLQVVIEAVEAGSSAIAAVPVSDTIKRVDGSSGRVVETLDRRQLWCAQTPQGFARNVLMQSYDEAWQSFEDGGPTDEASLVEAAGFTVCVVPDSPRNIKVTTPADFVVAEALADE